MRLRLTSAFVRERRSKENDLFVSLGGGTKCPVLHINKALVGF
jgi:hypothetical protein